MQINFLTIFPNYFKPFLEESLIKKAIEKGIININVIDIREFAEDKHKKVDDIIFGGSPGMLLKVEPIFNALQTCKGHKVILSPQGKLFSQKKAKEFANLPELTLVAGRYEGFDERVISFVDEEISIGDYILSGGELAAMVVAESTLRLVKGVIGNPESLKTESFASGLLDFAQYTRPREFRNLKVPEILLSGNQAKIQEWQQQSRIEKTKKNRKDLWERWKNNQKNAK